MEVRENKIIEGIKRVRAERGLTQEDMASILGVTRATYINIETGKRDLSVKELEVIQKSLNVSLIDLVDPILENRVGTEEKLRQIYLYVLEKYFRGKGVTKTKLAKILYLIDFTNFYENLESMSGSRYIRRNYGPVANPFFALTDELYEEGKINIRPLDYAQMIEPVASYTENFSLITEENKEIVDKVCSYWRDKRTAEIVNFTHSQKPWQECRDGEEIPYSLIIQEDPEHVYAPIAS